MLPFCHIPKKPHRLAMQNIGRDSLGVENHYARERPCPLKIRAAGQSTVPPPMVQASVIMIALPTKKSESIANRQNITTNTAAAALRFLILFERERAISSERISAVPFAIVGKSLCKWRYVSLHFSQVFMRHIVAKNSRQEQRKAGEQRLREEQRHQGAKGRYKE